ncbi:MAG: hypothetical protein C4327_00900 [Meiothermus sp.]
MTWLYSLPFVLLPLFAVGFVAGAAFLGVLGFRRGLFRRQGLLWAYFLLVGLVGGASQLLGPIEAVKVPWVGDQGPTRNLFSPETPWYLFSYDPMRRGEWRPDGFVRFYRREGLLGISSDLYYSVQQGTILTQSLYFRSDGDITLQLSFWTKRGRQIVPTRVVNVGGGLKRAYATYQISPGDEVVQGPDIVQIKGDWTYVDIGYAQLEPGSFPSAYQSSGLPDPTRTERFVWWFGTALLGLLVFYGASYLLTHVDRSRAALMITLGLVIHLGVGVWQHFSNEPRVAGLTANPNIFGASGVVLASLVWLLGGWRLALIALVAMTGTVWFSGSRAAFLGGACLGLAWLGGLPRAWKLAAATLVVLAIDLGLFLGGQERLGRFMTITDLNAASTQSRLQIWQVAWQAFKEHPLTGIGANRFGLYYLEHRPPDALEPTAPHAHNLFLNLLAETGLLGMSAFLILWGAIVWTLIRLRAWKGLIFLGIAFLLNLFDYTFFSAEVYYPLWVGIAWAILQAEGNQSAQVTSTPLNQTDPDKLER